MASLNSRQNTKGLFKVVAKANNTSGQPAGNSLFKIEAPATADHSLPDYVSYDETTGILTVRSGQYPLEVVADFVTAGTGNANLTYFLRDITKPVTEIYGTIGHFGNPAIASAATARVPAKTLVRLDVRSATSAHNQFLQAGSELRVWPTATFSPGLVKGGPTHSPSKGIDVLGTLAVNTYHDLSVPGAILEMVFADSSSGRPWQCVRIDIDTVRQSDFGYIELFDNDYIRFYVDNAEEGLIRITDVGRQMKYIKSFVWVPE